MRLKLYCNRFKHFKDALVCSVGCPYRTRCQDFALFYDRHREQTDALVEDYYAKRQLSAAAEISAPASAKSANTFRVEAAMPVAPRLSSAVIADLSSLVRLEVKRVMPELTYIWIGKDDQAEVLEHEEVIRRAERGAKPKSIFKVAQEMELRFQLVPRRGIDRAKRVAAASAAAEAGRAAARRSRPRLITPEPATTEMPDEAVPSSTNPVAPPRRQRAPRLAKAVGEK